MSDIVYLLPFLLVPVIIIFLILMQQRNVSIPKWKARAADTNETIEFELGRLGALMLLVFVAIPIAYVFYPSNYIIFFHWPWVSGLIAFALLMSLLRESRWSPFYAGAPLTVSPSGVAGRGGWLGDDWSLNWDQIDYVDWGRYGLFFYKKGRNSWDVPYRQSGPLGVGYPAAASYINARLAHQIRPSVATDEKYG